MKTPCPICQRETALFPAGDFRSHGPRDNPCLGSRCTPEAAARLILPPLNDEQMTLFRDCWNSGDWRPIELAFGIRMPQYNLYGETPEEELADLVSITRKWLETLVQLSQDSCHA